MEFLFSICKSSFSVKFKIPDTTFICANMMLNQCFIPIQREDTDTYIIKLESKLLMKYPTHCTHLRLKVFNGDTNNFEYFSKYTFEYLSHDDTTITLLVNDCRRETNIFIPFDEEIGQCKLRLVAEECSVPFHGKLFNLNNTSSNFNIDYLPLCWMCFSRSPLIIIILDENDDQITIKYKRGQFSELSNNIYTKYYSSSIITTNIGSEIFGISDGKGYFIKSL